MKAAASHLVPGILWLDYYDCTVDLTLVKFIFRAFEEASKVLDRQNAEEILLADVRDILNNFPDYPTAI